MEVEERASALPRRMEPPWTQRGHDLTRLLALSDGVFAFAMTLLVLGLALPPGFDPRAIGAALYTLRSAFLTYALSFFVIWFYWLSHNQVFSYITSYDRRLQQLNVSFLLFVAVMPFVTNLLAAASGEVVAVVLYALVQVAAGGALSLLWLYATRERRHVPSTLPRSWVEYVGRRSALGPLVFAASIPVAFVSAPLAEYSWVSLFVLQALVRFLHRQPAGAPIDPE